MCCYWYADISLSAAARWKLRPLGQDVSSSAPGGSHWIHFQGFLCGTSMCQRYLIIGNSSVHFILCHWWELFMIRLDATQWMYCWINIIITKGTVRGLVYDRNEWNNMNVLIFSQFKKNHAESSNVCHKMEYYWPVICLDLVRWHIYKRPMCLCRYKINRY